MKKELKIKNEVYPFLKTSYFSFPLMQKGLKFELIDSYSLHYKSPKECKLLKETRKISNNHLFFHMYADIIMNAIKQEKLDKKFKDCWIVPILITDFSEDELMIEVDILRPIKSKVKKK